VLLHFIIKLNNLAVSSVYQMQVAVVILREQTFGYYCRSLVISSLSFFSVWCH